MDTDVFVPAGFTPPTSLVRERFRLEPLGPQHNEADLADWHAMVDVNLHGVLHASHAALEILDSFGQRSVLSFTQVVVNPALPASSFAFKPSGDSKPSTSTSGAWSSTSETRSRSSASASAEEM